MEQDKKADLDWANLGFSYTRTPWRFHAYYRDGQWQPGELVESNEITLSEGSTAINYGQQIFEGMKAYTLMDGRVALFRPEENAARFTHSAERLAMPPVPHDLFFEAVESVVQNNLEYIPPFGLGASFYLRPLMLGIGDNLGVTTSKEFIFVLFGSPVGPYFKQGSGNGTIKLTTAEVDRAAPLGVGDAKCGGNYSAGLSEKMRTGKEGYNEILYLDPKTRTYIEETGASNFFAIQGDRLITPSSPTILQSIVRRSILEMAESMGFSIEERPVLLTELENFDEVACCGTGVGIAIVSEIRTKEKTYFFEKKEVSKIKMLDEQLFAIQRATPDALPGFAEKWLAVVE